MNHIYRNFSTLLVSTILLMNTCILNGTVDDITGDTGSPQSGSLILTGGTSGAQFDSTAGTLTESFNYLSLPLTTSSVGQIIIGSEPVLHNFGVAAQNIFVGGFAGNFSTPAAMNTACGASALNSLGDSSFNTAVGHASLINLVGGGSNVAVGDNAGSNIVNGNSNIFIGQGAGQGYFGDEVYNIIIGNNPGVADENNVIRIGVGGQQIACYVDGIYGQEVDPDTGTTVFVDSVGKLGTLDSSSQFKENVRNIGNDSSPILHLSPVSFNFKSDPKKTKRFGLLPAKTAKIMPDLVIKDKNGNPFAVRNDELPVLLLRELQKMVARIEKLEDDLKAAQSFIQALENIE